MIERETSIKRWFDMWLNGVDSGIEHLFSKDAVYMESWGPEYHGINTIRHWFREWNERGNVLKWDIQQFFHKENQTIVEWFFMCRMKDGKQESFDGISIIEWDADGKISILKEFACQRNRYNPYEDGPNPIFRI